MKVGLLTGGGDCPGLNAVIRAVSKTLMLDHDAEIYGFEDGFLGLIEQRVRKLDYRDVSGILATGGTILGTHNKANPFEYFGRDGADVSEEVLAYYRELGLDAVVVIGGDGTMTISHRFQQMGMNLVGVPKTIDNDLVLTDQTFGFDTAVSIATDAVDRLQTTGKSHQRVMILETMGRYAGWIALHSAVAGGADVVLIPELPYDIDRVAEACAEREERQRFTIIVVAEGAKPVDGEHTVHSTVEDSPDPIRLGGVGNVIRNQLEDRLDSEIRTTVLGHIQRGGTPTAYDRILATQYGAYAARLVADGEFDRMVALQNGVLTSVPLADVANQVKTVPEDSELVAAARSVGMVFAEG